jgi:hypothetical protein
MTKLQRQQAAWKYQYDQEAAAEAERLAKLATYVDVELQALNQAEMAKLEAKKVKYYKHIGQTEVDPSRDPWTWQVEWMGGNTLKVTIDPHDGTVGRKLALFEDVFPDYHDEPYKIKEAYFIAGVEDYMDYLFEKEAHEQVK